MTAQQRALQPQALRAQRSEGETADQQAEQQAELLADVIEPLLLQMRKELRERQDATLASAVERLASDVAQRVVKLAQPHIEGRAYNALSMVTCRGGLFQAIEDTLSAPPALSWRLLANGISDLRAFVDAEDPRGFTLVIEDSTGAEIALEHRIPFPIHRGAWERREYEQADEVAWLGCTWRAIRDTGTEPPGTDWRLVAKAGDRGRRGGTGPMGAPGRDGVDGRDGKSANAGVVVKLVLDWIEKREEAGLESFVAWLDKQHLELPDRPRIDGGRL